MPEPACPACVESDLLQGHPVEHDIEITCGRCGAQWMRGEPRCKRCGRGGGTTVRQLMTVYPRGTLLAVVGARQVPLCSACDSEVLAAALEHNQAVPETYLSRFLFGEVEQRTAPEPRPASRKRTASKEPARPSPRATSRSPEPSGRTATPTAPSAPPGPADPTVRQATEAFLNDAGEPAHGLTMVLLGTKWGASTRLSRLDTVEAAAELAAWVEQTFRARPDQRAQAVVTLRRAIEHWRDHGWLTKDLAARLD